jgi:EmrB/QacA subfamily drug resistance transporter
VETAASRRAALIAVTMMSFMSPFMLSGMNIALPSIGKEFSSSAVLLTWISTAFSLATAVFLVPAGKLADIYGRKRLFIIGVCVYMLSSVLCALSASTPMLIGARVLQGLSSAMLFSTGMAILTSVYPASERGRVLGINTATVYLGMSIGPFLGGIIVESLGWRAVFWVTVPLALATLLFTLSQVKGEWADSPDDTLDVGGSLLYAVAIVALIVGFGQLPAIRGVGILLGGLVAAVLFLRLQSRSPSPVLDLAIFRGNRVFTMSSIAALINYAATFCVVYLMSLYLQTIKALSPAQAGLMLVAQPIVQTIVSPFAGRISDRVEARYVASAGMALTAVGIAMLSVLTAGTATAYIVASLVVLGLGFGLFSSPNTSALMGAVQRRHYAVAAGLVSLMRTFGQMVSLGMVMILFTINMGQAQVTPEHYAEFLVSMRTTYVISAVLCALGVIASLSRGKNVLAHQPVASPAPEKRP